jgi:hypothetical protein
MIASSDCRSAVLALLHGHFSALADSFADAPDDIRAALVAEASFREAPIDASVVSGLEADLPAPLPPALRVLLSVGYFRAIEAHEFILPGVDPRNPLASAGAALLHRELWPCGYLQVGFGPCGDPLCLDIRQPQPSGEYPVVVFNHDLIPAAAWKTRETLQPFAVTVAQSFLALLTGLCTLNEGPPWGPAA